MADEAIVVQGLEKSYGSVRALGGVDFAARTGSVLGAMVVGVATVWGLRLVLA